MDNLDQLIAGPLGLFGLLLIALWVLLMFFAPFFWYSTWKQAKEINKKFDSLNKA